MNIYCKENLINYINNYEPEICDKKQKGSVFTNTNIINDMLNLLPIDVWNNPNLKWLDPCCGIGNFSIIIYYRLMDNLPISDEEIRRKHIIEKMLYFIELDNQYIKILKDIFHSDKYSLNIFNGTYVYLHTLDQSIPIYNQNIFNYKFDIIVTNPPYQKINMKNKSKLSAKPLYHLFVEVSIKELVKDGYLLLIHPVSWRRKSKEIRIIHDILNKKLLYIFTNNNYKEFGLSAPYINYYLLQNTNYDDKYKTKYETYFNNKYYTGLIHLRNDLLFLPVLLTENTIQIIYKMINKTGSKLDIQLESKLSTEKKNISKYNDNEFKYLNLHTYSQKNGRIYRYSNKIHPCHNKLKILMNFKGGYKYLDPFIDNGTMGITDNSMRLYVNNDNKNLLLKYLKSDLIYFLLMITTYNYGSNQKNEFHIMNLITIPDTEDFYNFYMLTKKEINFINESINL